jgi:hypothetical protein
MLSLAISTSAMNDLIASYCKHRPAGVVGVAFSSGAALAGGLGAATHV